MHIHFVCTGNTYRSRLAETYFKSKQFKNIEASSSGINAIANSNGSICWYTARLVKKERLINFTKHTWSQTTPQILETADLVIFMSSKHHEYCKNEYKFDNTNYEIWDIPDLDELGFAKTKTTFDKEKELIQTTEKTFVQIKKHVDELVNRLNKLQKKVKI